MCNEEATQWGLFYCEGFHFSKSIGTASSQNLEGVLFTWIKIIIIIKMGLGLGFLEIVDAKFTYIVGFHFRDFILFIKMWMISNQEKSMGVIWTYWRKLIQNDFKWPSKSNSHSFISWYLEEPEAQLCNPSKLNNKSSWMSDHKKTP